MAFIKNSYLIYNGKIGSTSQLHYITLNILLECLHNKRAGYQMANSDHIFRDPFPHSVLA